MAKSVHNSVLDAMLNFIVDNSDQLSVCSSQPTTYSQAITSYMLAISSTQDISSTAPADGVVSGRRITIPQNFSESAPLTITNGGTAQHVALVGSIASTNTLLYVTTCTAQALIASGSVTVPAWDIEVRDPA